MSAITEKIRTRGYWRFVIRPATFDRDRLPFADLEVVLRRAAVGFRGWDLPHFQKDGLVRGGDFIGSETDWNHHVESWRFYQSGQFVILKGMPLDWRDQSWFPGSSSGLPEGPSLGVIETLWTITEVFELAARLASTAAGDEELVVVIEVGNIQGRLLFVDEARRAPLYEDHRATTESFAQEFALPRDDLLASPDDAALDAAAEVFLRFGWHPDREALRDGQQELRRL